MEQTRQADKGMAVGMSFVAAIGGFLFGFDTAVINGAVIAIREEFGMSATIVGLVVASALVGAALGAGLAGRVADRFGRIPLMLGAALLFAASAVGAGLATGPWSLLVWRIVGGVGVGAASVAAPMYIAEIAPAHLRGRLGSLQQPAIVIGIFVALLSDALLVAWAGGANRPLWLGLDAWRWMFLVGLIPAVVYGVLARRLPESPRYLVARGQLDRAAGSLQRSLGGIDVHAKIRDIAETLRGGPKPTLRDLRGPAFGLQPVVWVGIGLSVLQQFVGINVIFYYSSTLWRAVGFSEANALTVTVLTSVTNVLVTLVAIALVNRIGRRPLLIAGSAGMLLSLATMAVCFSYAQTTEQGLVLPAPFSTLALIAANVYVVFFGASWGPVVWVLLGEMFPNQIRASALALAAGMQWVANFLVSTTFPVFADTLGLGFTYGIYATFAGLSFIFVLKSVPETKGKELEEMSSRVGPLGPTAPARA